MPGKIIDQTFSDAAKEDDMDETMKRREKGSFRDQSEDVYLYLVRPLLKRTLSSVVNNVSRRQ